MLRPLPAALEDESSVSAEWDAKVQSGELPSRSLSSVVVFEAIGDRQRLRDLQALDGPDPPPLTLVGRLTRLSAEGEPVAEEPAGPLVRVTAAEWSIEYDELAVTIWVSTHAADYRLLSPGPQYAHCRGMGSAWA